MNRSFFMSQTERYHASLEYVSLPAIGQKRHMKYRTYNGLDLPKIDQEILAFWKEHQIFEQSTSTERKETFTFYEGPPSANGKPGIHHVMARTVIDLVCRYHTMKGKRVERKGGWGIFGVKGYRD